MEQNLSIQKGKFFIFEGVNGCGKSTQQELLFVKLLNDNFKVAETSEPSEFPIGRVLRKSFLSGKMTSDQTLIAKLFAMDRYHQAIQEKNGIIYLINNGFNIIQSRNFLSSMALEYAKCHDEKVFETIFEYNLDTIKLYQNNKIEPVIFFIDVDPLECIKRQEKMHNIKDIHESEEFMIHQRIAYHKAITFLDDKGFKIHIINANNLDSEKLHNIICEIVYPLLK